MRFHEEAARDAYDAIVVGSGLGGLTAAALLARAGQRVLVLERHDRPGGYAHAFRRRGYRFDSAVHVVGGCEPGPFEEGALLHRVLAGLGVRERCDFARVDPAYRVEWPGFALEAPSELERFVEAHVEHFPHEAKGIRGFVSDCLTIRTETSRAEQGAGPQLRPERFPLLLRYRRATLAQVLEDRVEDPAARAALGALWPFLGLPPSRVSFLYFATMLMSYVADGTYYCRGTFQALAEALAEALLRRGGELVLRSPVRRILVEEGRAVGVVLENGQRIRAPLVISNADARQTVLELVGAEHFPKRYRRRLVAASQSISAFVVYAATSLDLGKSELAHETFLYEGPDHDAAYASALGPGASPSWLSITAPSVLDPGLAPFGESLLVLTTLIDARAAARWRDAKPLLQQSLLRLAARRLPGLERELRFAESATPRSFERYTRNQDGALYGFDVTPAQVGPGRLDNETPLPGLLLAGHWTRPGGGVVGVVRSGLRTARIALGLERDAELGV